MSGIECSSLDSVFIERSEEYWTRCKWKRQSGRWVGQEVDVHLNLCASRNMNSNLYDQGDSTYEMSGRYKRMGK